MEQANPQMGEMEIELLMARTGARRRFVLRATPRATLNIEKALQMGIGAVSQAIMSLNLEHFAHILCEGIKAGEREAQWKPTPDALIDPIWFSGVTNIYVPVMEYLKLSRTGGAPEDLLKKAGFEEVAKPPEETATEPTTEVYLGANGPDSQPSS